MFHQIVHYLTLVTTRTTGSLVAALAGLALTAALLGGVAAVPDARITIDAVGAAPDDPVVGERTEVNLTVANSAGSPAAANVTEVRLLDGDETLDARRMPGSLSPGDTLDAELWTRFDEPGERRLTVMIVAEEPLEDGEDVDEDDRRTVRVERDLFVDVRPAAETVSIRARALTDAELRVEDDEDGIDVNGINGIIGGGGGLDTDDEEDAIEPMDSPVAVTVVNTGTVPAERVSVTASDDAGDVGTAPFVVPDVAPGDEHRIVVDLGPVDRRSNVTLTTRYDAANRTDRTASTTLRYPPRDGDPVVTDATVTSSAGETVVDASLGNVGERQIDGVVVGIDGARGVEPTPAGGDYFVGTVGAGEFVPFELATRANATVAEEVPVRIEYTDRDIRYVETVPVELPDEDDETDGAGTIGTLGASVASDRGIGVVLALIGILGATALGAVLRRRDV